MPAPSSLRRGRGRPVPAPTRHVRRHHETPHCHTSPSSSPPRSHCTWRTTASSSLSRAPRPAHHLAGGIVPIAALAVAAALLPRVRAGLRGALTLLIGFAGVMVGSEAAYFTAIGHASGDDWTGLLALLAGRRDARARRPRPLALAPPRRQRRPPPRPPPRRPRRHRVARGLPRGDAVRDRLRHDPHRLARTSPRSTSAGPFQDVTVPSADGVELSGWYVPSRNRAAVVIVAMGRTSPGPHARMLARNGYGVLVIDPRGWGAATATRTRSPGPARRTSAARSNGSPPGPRSTPARVGGLGLSVGGEMMIQAAAETDAPGGGRLRGRRRALRARVPERRVRRRLARPAAVPGAHRVGGAVRQRHPAPRPGGSGRRGRPSPCS